MAAVCHGVYNGGVAVLGAGRDAVCALADLAARITEVTCAWLKPSQGFKNLVVKPLNIACKITVEYGFVVGKQLQSLFAAAKVTKPLINLTDAVSKIPDLFKTYSHSVFRSRGNDGEAAVQASVVEQGLKTAAKLSDWTMSLYDMQEALGDFGIVDLKPKWVATTMTVMRVAGGLFALYNLAEELTKVFYTRNIVIKHEGHWIVRSMQTADYLHSALKIVMSLAYLGMAVMGASLAFQIATTSLTIANHFFKQIAVRSDVQAFV